MLTNIAIAVILHVGCQILPQGENILVKEIYNPSRKLKAIIFEKEGNATVNNSIQLSIVDNDFELEEINFGNVFICDLFEKLEKPNNDILEVNWSTDSSLIIFYPRAVRVINMGDKLGKISISYQEK